MLTDLTPTLYNLLGLEASPPHELAGRTLMLPIAGKSSVPRDMLLVQSSYSRVFGLIDGAGRWLYTADANHQREEFYDLHGGPESKTLEKGDRLRSANGSSSGFEPWTATTGDHSTVDNRCQVRADTICHFDKSGVRTISGSVL